MKYYGRMSLADNMRQYLLFVLSLGITFAVALPLYHPISFLSASDIKSIASDAASCNGASFPGECATAAEAAPWIDSSFRGFNIDAFGTQAALLSLILYETSSFKYKINHYPGVPGQGTRNMQSPAFNLKYAEWLAENARWSGITEQQVANANVKGPAEVLALVNNDRWGFASAAWYLTTQCDESVRSELAASTEDGWNAYLTDCVGTTVTEDRTAIWEKAIAMGGW